MQRQQTNQTHTHSYTHRRRRRRRWFFPRHVRRDDHQVNMCTERLLAVDAHCIDASPSSSPSSLSTHGTILLVAGQTYKCQHKTHDAVSPLPQLLLLNMYRSARSTYARNKYERQHATFTRRACEARHQPKDISDTACAIARFGVVAFWESSAAEWVGRTIRNLSGAIHT